MVSFLSRFDDGIHLRVLLKGVEAAVVIFVGIKMYELLKDIIEVDLLKNSIIPIQYHKLVTHIIHFVSIFVAEIILVYLLTILFQTEF